jgi:hypothetical protein
MLKLLAQCEFQEIASPGLEQAGYEMKLILPLSEQPITFPLNATGGPLRAIRIYSRCPE